MKPNRVVERCDEIEDGRAGFGSRGEVPVVVHLGLEGLEEGLDDRVVETVTRPRRRRQEAASVESLLNLVGEVLTTSVGVEDQTWLWPTVRDGHLQRLDHELLGWPGAYRPTNY